MELAALVEGLPNVQDAAQNLSPLFQSITVDYEPDPTFFPSWTWNFTVAVSYYEQAAILCHEFARQLMAYPSGRPLLEGDLQQYAWDYGVFAQAANSIDVETQGYTNGSKWSAAMTKLTDQLNQTDVPLNHLTVQLSFGSGGNGVNESTVIQDVRIAYALSVTGDFLFWTLQDSAWLVPILAAIENNSLSDSLVTFTESGLVNGTSWSVELNGDLESSTATTIVFSEAEGTFAFTIGPVSGFSASPYRGQLTVDGNATYQAVDFAPTQGSSYPVLVTESQLPSSYRMVGEREQRVVPRVVYPLHLSLRTEWKLHAHSGVLEQELGGRSSGTGRGRARDRRSDRILRGYVPRHRHRARLADRDRLETSRSVDRRSIRRNRTSPLPNPTGPMDSRREPSPGSSSTGTRAHRSTWQVTK